MAKLKGKRNPTLVEELKAESSFELSRAQGFEAMGMGETTTQPLWAAAASL
jgi:hypothetical protein